MRKIVCIFSLLVMISCSSTQRRYEVDPCQLDIKHPDILKCLERKAIDDYTGKIIPSYDTALCECKKEFFKSIKIGE